MRERWTVTKVAIAHRTGTVLVGEPSVIIAVSSAHRRESLEVRVRKEEVTSDDVSCVRCRFRGSWDVPCFGCRCCLPPYLICATPALHMPYGPRAAES